MSSTEAPDPHAPLAIPRRPTHYDHAQTAHTTAGKRVQGDRRETHGDFAVNFASIAALWTGYFVAKGYVMAPISLVDVALMMDLMKTGRTMNGGHNPDDYVDKIGYSMIAAGLAGDEARRKTEAEP